MFLYILTITILFYSLLLHYYKLIFSSLHITSFLYSTQIYIFTFPISFCHILNNPYLKTYTFNSPSHRHAKKTANKLFYNCSNLKNFYVFLINTICLFSVFFSITNRGFFASIFFYIYFTKLWLSLSLSLTVSTVSYFIISFVHSFAYFLLPHFII